MRHVAIIPLTIGAVGQAATVYTTSSIFRITTGYAAVFITSSAGSITVSQQCSMNTIDWYDPIDSSTNILGLVCTALTVTTGTYIQFDPVISPYIRFKIIEGNVGATTVTIKLLLQEEG